VFVKKEILIEIKSYIYSSLMLIHLHLVPYFRPQMAKLFWELGEEPVTSALSASRLYHSMSKNLPTHESHLKEVFAKHEV